MTQEEREIVLLNMFPYDALPLIIGRVASEQLEIRIQEMYFVVYRPIGYPRYSGDC